MIVDRDGDRWLPRQPDDGPPIEIHYQGTAPLVSAFTGPPVSMIPLPGRPRPLHRVWGTPRPLQQRAAPRVAPELRALAQRQPRAASAEQQAFEHFLAHTTWECEGCGTRVHPDRMRVPQPIDVDGTPTFHIYCSDECLP